MFATAEPISALNSIAYSQVLACIILWYGFAYTIVLDKESILFVMFVQTCELMDLNVHTVSSNNPDAVLVKCVNKFLNRGLKIFTNKRNSPLVEREIILLLLYAWNLYPVRITNITQSMIDIGCKLPLLIDFSHEKTVKLASFKKLVFFYRLSKLPSSPEQRHYTATPCRNLCLPLQEHE